MGSRSVCGSACSGAATSLNKFCVSGWWTSLPITRHRRQRFQTSTRESLQSRALAPGRGLPFCARNRAPKMMSSLVTKEWSRLRPKRSNLGRLGKVLREAMRLPKPMTRNSSRKQTRKIAWIECGRLLQQPGWPRKVRATAATVAKVDHEASASSLKKLGGATCRQSAGGCCATAPSILFVG